MVESDNGKPEFITFILDVFAPLRLVWAQPTLIVWN